MKQIENINERKGQNVQRYDRGYRSVHFNLKQQKEPLKPTQIMMAVLIGDTRYRIYIRYRVEPVFWDRQKGCCKSDSLLAPRVRTRMDRINRAIGRIAEDLDLADKQAAEEGRFLTLDDLRDVVMDRHYVAREPDAARADWTSNNRVTSGPDPMKVLYQIADRFDSSISNKGQKGAAASRKSYHYSCRRLEAFVKENDICLDSFKRLDRSFYYCFAQWLISRSIPAGAKMKKYSSATIHATISCICNLHRKAYEAGYTDIPECHCSYHGNHWDPNDKIYLSEPELSKLYQLKSLTKAEEEVRDMFFLSSYTGLRISDINHLNDAVISDGTIRLFQKKTHGYVAIPLLKEVSEIIARYNGAPPRFPKINPSYANKLIKVLCKKAGIDAMCPVSEIRGGVVEARQCNKYELVSFHTARRSCITNLFRRGYSPNYLMTMSGHKSVSSFQRYIRTNLEELASDFMEELKRRKAI